MYYNKRLIGFINPGAFIHCTNSKDVFAYGPKGYCKISNSQTENVVQKLIHCKFLLPCKETDKPFLNKLFLVDSLSRSHSHLLNFVDSVQDFKNLIKLISTSTVLIVGCGGVGSNTSYLLASLGFKKIVLVDGDRIEISNLNRQVLFTKKDVGEFKTKILKRELMNRFDDLKISLRNSFLTPKAINMIDCDFIVVSADNPPNIVSEIIANGLSKPIFNAGYQIINGIITLDFPTKLKNIKASNDCVAFADYDIPPSSGPLNFKVSSLLSEQIIMFLLNKTKKGYCKMIYHDC